MLKNAWAAQKSHLQQGGWGARVMPWTMEQQGATKKPASCAKITLLACHFLELTTVTRQCLFLQFHVRMAWSTSGSSQVDFLTITEDVKEMTQTIYRSAHGTAGSSTGVFDSTVEFHNATDAPGGNVTESSLAVQAFLLVVIISVPVVLFIVVIFCSPSSKKRRKLHTNVVKPGNHINGSSPAVQANDNNAQHKQTTDTVVSIVNERETAVLANCRLSTYWRVFLSVLKQSNKLYMRSDSNSKSKRKWGFYVWDVRV